MNSGAALVVPLEVNTRTRLSIARHDLKQFRELHAGYIDRNQCIFKRQQLEDVAGAHFARGDFVFTQATCIHDRKRHRLSEFRLRLCSHSVGNKLSE